MCVINYSIALRSLYFDELKFFPIYILNPNVCNYTSLNHTSYAVATNFIIF